MNLENLCDPLISLYYKCLTQLQEMYSLCKTREVREINRSTSHLLTKCQMQRSKEIVQVQLLQMCQFLPAHIRSKVARYKFECVNSKWEYLYFQLCKLKTMHSLDLHYLMAICVWVRKYGDMSEGEYGELASLRL